MTENKYTILVNDPTGSEVQTASGAICKMTKPGTISVTESPLSILSGATLDVNGQSIVATRAPDFTNLNRSTLQPEGKTGVVSDSFSRNLTLEHYPGMSRLLDKINPAMRPGTAQPIHAEALARAGVDCSENGQKVSPVLTVEDLDRMGKNSKGKVITQTP